ncbi:hypothetical protein Cgig2_029176 [Carnegiea gigantea]|uniref:Uncharacterized protein n=1 Tax=Carnegiea gigantea TaxID=171969 RepID=A0A9Q1KKM9_9CARY|nr:hypothetical protein Cgig2_029176 [Carnegiea gigantea]
MNAKNNTDEPTAEKKENKLKTCDLLFDQKHHYNLPWLLGVSLNEILFNFEKREGPTKLQSVLEVFKETIDMCDLSDLGYSGTSSPGGIARTLITPSRKRSGTNFLKFGDHSSSWFHQKANVRRSVNHMAELKDGNGNICIDPEDLKLIIVGFFRDIFSVMGSNHVESAPCSGLVKVNFNAAKLAGWGRGWGDMGRDTSGGVRFSTLQQSPGLKGAELEKANACFLPAMHGTWATWRSSSEAIVPD